MSETTKAMFHAVLMNMLYLLDTDPKDELRKDLIRREILQLQEELYGK